MFWLGHNDERRLLASAWSGDEGAVRDVLIHKLELLNTRVSHHLGRQHPDWEEGATALHLAAAAGHGPIVALLLSLKANLHAVSDAGATPLHTASARGHDGVVVLLLDHVAKVDARDNLGQTPLHVAAAAGHASTVQTLLRRNASWDTCDGDGNTPLHTAAFSGSVAVVKLLTAAGAKVNEHNQRGRTPLHMAVLAAEAPSVVHAAVHSGETSGAAVIVRILLGLGADINAKDSLGKTPLDLLSERTGDIEGFPLVELLVTKGGKWTRDRHNHAHARTDHAGHAGANHHHEPAPHPDSSGTAVVDHGHFTSGRDPVVLGDQPVIIGRNPDCDVRYRSRTLSRKHAKIERQGAGFVISDLGSHNGVVINGYRITDRRLLRAGDSIVLGAYEFEFDGERLIPAHGELPDEQLQHEHAAH